MPIQSDDGRRRLIEGSRRLDYQTVDQAEWSDVLNECSSKPFELSFVKIDTHYTLVAMPLYDDDSVNVTGDAIGCQEHNFGFDFSKHIYMMSAVEAESFLNEHAILQYELGSFPLGDIYEAFDSTNKASNYTLWEENCGTFSRSVWLKLDVEEDQSLADFVVESILSDSSIMERVPASDAAKESFVRNLIYSKMGLTQLASIPGDATANTTGTEAEDSM